MEWSDVRGLVRGGVSHKIKSVKGIVSSFNQERNLSFLGLSLDYFRDISCMFVWRLKRASG